VSVERKASAACGLAVWSSSHPPALLKRVCEMLSKIIRVAKHSAPCPPACALCTAGGALPENRSRRASSSHLPHTLRFLGPPKAGTRLVSNHTSGCLCPEPACAPCPRACAPCTAAAALLKAERGQLCAAICLALCTFQYLLRQAQCWSATTHQSVCALSQHAHHALQHVRLAPPRPLSWKAERGALRAAICLALCSC
jgi:hypothetical protein